MGVLTLTDTIERNKTFSGCDMVASIDILDASGNRHSYVLGTLLTLTYSTFQDKKPVRALGNINAKDYVCGPRTIAGSMVFSIFNKHILYEISNASGGYIYDGYIMDELPPFDITISLANEYGAKARMALYGVRIISEGQTMSVNDIYTENTYQYFAHDLQYIKDEDKSIFGGTLESIKYNQAGGSLSPESSGYQAIWSYDSGGSTSSESVGQIPILLTCRTENAMDDISMGSAAFTLNPSQSAGTTTVTNVLTQHEMVISNVEFPGQIVYAPLAQGQYSARYANEATGEQSNEVQFSIGAEVDAQTLIPAPMILQRYGTSLKARVNCSAHTQLKYGETGESTVYSTATVTDDTVLITGLTQNMQYTIYSCDDSTESLKTIVSTKDSSTEMFNFLDTIISNNSELIQSPVAQSVLTEAKSIFDSIGGSEYEMPFSVADSLATVKANAVSQMDSADDYIIVSLRNVIDACNELSDIVIDTANAEDYFINKNSETSFASRPAVTNGSFGSVGVSPDSDKIIICNPLNGMMVEGVATSEGECISMLNMLPEGKYNIMAIDTAGTPSPYSEFTVLSDSEKTARYNRYLLASIGHEIDSEAARQQLLASNREFVGFDTELQSRALIEAATTIGSRVVSDPAIIASSAEEIVAQVNIHDAEFDFYLAICKMDKAITSVINFKQKIEHTGYTEIVFEAEKYGLFEGETYCLWIEDQNQQRVSGMVTTKIEDISGDEQINQMILGLRLSKFKTELAGISGYGRIEELVAAVYSDAATSRLNMYDKAIEKAIQIEPNMAARDSVVGCILQLKYRYNTDISKSYSLILLSNVVDYKRGSFVSQAAYAASVNIVAYADDECQFSAETGGSVIELQPAISSSEYVYVMMKMPGASEYAGFILISCRTGLETHYKINVREVA
jgi:hypothetical protein